MKRRFLTPFLGLGVLIAAGFWLHSEHSRLLISQQDVLNAQRAFVKQVQERSFLQQKILKSPKMAEPLDQAKRVEILSLLEKLRSMEPNLSGMEWDAWNQQLAIVANTFGTLASLGHFERHQFLELEASDMAVLRSHRRYTDYVLAVSEIQNGPVYSRLGPLFEKILSRMAPRVKSLLLEEHSIR